MRYYIIKSNHKTPFTNISFSPDMMTHNETEIIHYKFTNGHQNIPIALVKGHILISSSLKEVFALYSHVEIKKQIILLDSHSDKSLSYWLLEGMIGDYLSDETTYHGNKSIAHMVLDRSKIRGRHIMGINMIKASHSKLIPIKLVVSLALAESLLRRGVTEISFEEVSLNGGESIG